MTGAADLYDAHRKFLTQKRGETERLFRTELTRAQVRGVWTAPDGFPVTTVMQASRTSDLVILGQSGPKDPESYVADNFMETVLLGAGSPVLLIPETGSFEAVGDRVLIAWNGSREAARAIRDAIPLLACATRVTVAAVSTAFKPGPTEASCADVAAMLQRHVAPPWTLRASLVHRRYRQAKPCSNSRAMANTTCSSRVPTVTRGFTSSSLAASRARFFLR